MSRCFIDQQCDLLPRAAALPGAGRGAQRLLCLAGGASSRGRGKGRAGLGNGAGRGLWPTTNAATARAGCGSPCGKRPPGGPPALRTALRRRGRHALQPKSFAPRTTDSTHGLRCAPNRLLDQPRPTQANRVWVSDITYLPLANGAWAYLCAFQDVGSKHVVGWHVRAAMPEELVTTALQRALLAQRPAPGLIVHSDRGGQYVGNAYKALLHGPRPGSRIADAATATITPKPRACGPGSKPRSSNSATGPFLPTWPTRRPAWPLILTTTITSVGTPVSAIRSLINFTNNNLTTSPNSLLLN